MRNPKQEGSNLYDCRPQVGSCPIGCNQCFYNRPGAYYTDINEPNIPDPNDVYEGNGIVRMNCGHDSNLERRLVIDNAVQYDDYFFNTSIANYDFPGPVVLTINCCEEEPKRSILPPTVVPPNLMFVRIRLSASNLGDAHRLVTDWSLADVPIVITFMAYYDKDVFEGVVKHRHPFYNNLDDHLYEYKIRHINKYWCPTRAMKVRTMKSLGVERNRLLTTCCLESEFCKDCKNCESYYWITRRRLDAIKEIDKAAKA